MRLTPVTLSGSIVRLEPLLAAHASDLAAVGLDPELWRLQPSMIASLDDMEAYVASALDDQDRGVSLCFVLVSQRTGTVIGTTRFMDIALAHRRLEIGATWVTTPIREPARISKPSCCSSGTRSMPLGSRRSC